MTVNERRGRVSSDPHHDANAQFVRKFYAKDIGSANITNCINDTKRKFISIIQQSDPSLLKGAVNPSLKQLKKIADDNGIDLRAHVKMYAKREQMKPDDAQLMKDVFGLEGREAVQKWRMLRDKYAAALVKAGQKLSDETMKSLTALMKAAKEHGVELSKSNEKAWQLHERDVVDGMQKFLDSGDIVVDGKVLEKNACRAEKAGGNVHSDVKVVTLC